MRSLLKEGSLEISGFKVKAREIEYEVEALTVNVGGNKNDILPKKDSEDKVWL